MIRFLSTLWLIVVVAITSANTLPQILIVQSRAPEKDGADPNLFVGNYLAAEIESSGKLGTIVWSMTDPQFRAAVDAGRIKNPAENPSPNEVRLAGRALGVNFILTTSAVKVEGSLVASVELIRVSGSRMWKDQKTFNQTLRNLPDWDGNASSLARTWAAIMNAEIFKGEKTQPLIPTPEPTPPKTNDMGAARLPKPDEFNEASLTRALQLLAKGQAIEAVMMLRDIVDGSPQNPRARSALVQALLVSGQLQAAALEARRAVRLAPEKNDLRLLAARAWLALGKPEEALLDLNEALARDGGNPFTQVLRGEVALSREDYMTALEAFETAVGGNSDLLDARIGRLLANTFLGRPEPLISDLRDLLAKGESVFFESYSRIVDQSARASEKITAELKGTLPLLRTRPGDQSLITKIENLHAISGCLATLTNGVIAPLNHLESHQRRDLAQKLLVQATGDCLEFAKTGGEDQGSEAELSLGEAIKQFQLVRTRYTEENLQK